ncbi:uncharacterized protein LTR77_010958 [Saxophila tyrrhenica]|uniref:Uncharacterized protein n=1 Tax=Saxophila tyrrhenica TaxID=1690608 RepID=A0AAV9NU19_9PEZI|nr:hypothetical protein LTR77_010958 [Saxophila tyrrhenica]
MTWIKSALMAAIMASNIFAMPSPQRRSVGDHGTNLEGPVDPTKCPGGDGCGITSRSTAEQDDDPQDDITLLEASFTIDSVEKSDISTSNAMPASVLDDSWYYNATLRYKKAGSRPDKHAAFAYAQLDLDAQKRDELSDVNSPPESITTGKKPVNIVSVHGIEKVFHSNSGGSMRAGNALHAVSFDEHSNTVGGESWFFTCRLRILYHHTYTDGDFNVLRGYLVQSGENVLNAIGSIA